jgi:uncharacterized protein
MIRAFAAGLLLLLAACKAEAPAPPAKPALWEVTGPNGEQAWLFGTIHALPEAVHWHGPKLDAALAKSDRLVVEVTGLDDPARIGKIFAALATTPKQIYPPLSNRVDPRYRGQLEVLLRKADMEDRFAKVETWAAALTLAKAASPEQDAALGVDRALLAQWGKRPVVELEGAEAQLLIFDSLPEADQLDLLEATIAEASAGERSTDLAKAWANGDMAAIGAETTRGLLADPELRAALLVGRNTAWTDKIVALLKSKASPFIAVGAAHLAGTDGLPVLLAARGFTVTRVQ